MSARPEGHRLHRVQLAQDVDGAVQVARPARPRGAVSSRRMRMTSARSSSPRETMSLFSSTAGIGSTKRLAPEPERAVDDAGDLPAVLGLQQQHVAVVARGDELVLQHAVGVLAAQERLHDRLELRRAGGRGVRRISARRGRGVVGDLAARAGSRGGSAAATSVASGTSAARRASSRRALRPGPRAAPISAAALDERRHVEERRGSRWRPATLRLAQDGRRGPAGRGTAGVPPRRAGPRLPRWWPSASRTSAGVRGGLKADASRVPAGNEPACDSRSARIASNSRVRNVFAFKLLLP